MAKELRVFGLAMAALAGGCSHSYRGWEASRTKNVTVYTDAVVAHRFSQESLELALAAYKAILPSAPPEPIEVVFLASDPHGMTRFNRPWDDPRGGWTLESLPGEGPIGRRGLIVLESRDQETARQQLAHHLIGRMMPDAPLWLRLGLSQYLARYRIHYRGEVWMACFGSRAFPRLPGANRRDMVIPVEELLVADWTDYEHRRRDWLSYTSYLMVHFLIHGKPGFHERFPLFMEAITRGEPSQRALAAAYPHILIDEWDEALAVHARPLRNLQQLAADPALPQGLCRRIPPAHHARAKPRTAPVSEEDVRTVLDDLERVDLFRSHASWMPRDVVTARAAAQPSKRRPARPLPEEGESTGRGLAPHPDPSTPTLRTTP